MDHEILQETLKERELEILRYIADGWTNREIAQELVVSVNTVRWYNKQIYSKLDAHSRTLAIARARELGLLHGGGPQEAGAEPGDAAAASLPALPSQPTAFVGRVEELDQITRLLTETDCPLLTIVGPGGMGKTRLAIESAGLLVDDFEDGILFVSLVPISAAEDIAPTILSTLGLKSAEGEKPSSLLFDFLRDKSMLLVLDNFEHVLDGAQVIGEILSEAQATHVLATSRERLSLREETVFDLKGMTVPDRGAAEDAVLYSAVQLFLQSTRRVRPDYEPDVAALAAIAEICTMMSGMPLGIELAAAWMDMLSPAEIAREIGRNLDFLETDVRNVPERHRSMRAVFDSAWQHLPDEEKDTFARLSVFRGSFTREGAEAVTGTDLRGLMGLLTKSLLWRDAEDDRYAIHELLRQFAEERLRQSGAGEAAHEGHSRYYMQLLRSTANGPDAGDALAKLDVDFENIRRAWIWAAEHNDWEAMEGTHDALFDYCARLSRYEDAWRLFDRAICELAVDPDQPVPSLALHLYDHRGTLSGLMGHFERAVDDLCFVRDQVGETQDVAWAHEVLIRLSQVYRKTDQQHKADQHLLEVLAHVRARGDKAAEADVLYHLGTVAWDQGRNDEALAYHSEAVALSRLERPPGLTLVQALHGQGEALIFAGRSPEAIASLKESLALAEQIGDRSYVAENMIMIAWACSGIFGIADYDRALKNVRDSLAITGDTHLGWHHTSNMVGLGCMQYPVDYGAGLAELQRGMEMARRAGMRRELSFTYDQLGDAYRDLGLMAEAAAAHRQGLAYCDEVNVRFWLPRLEANVLIDRMHAGDLEVEDGLRATFEEARARDALGQGVRALEGLAELYVRRGEPGAALETARQLAEIAAQGGMREVLAQAHRWQGEAFLALDLLDEAASALSQAQTLADEIGRIKLRWDVYDGLARLAAARGESDEQRRHKEAIRTLVETIRASLDSEELTRSLPGFG